MRVEDDLASFRGILLAAGLGIAIWLLIFVPLAHAQQQSQFPLSVDILGNNLGQCYKAAAFQQENINKIQSELTASEAEVKRLTDKYEPKKDEPKPEKQ